MALLGHFPDLQVVAEAGNGREATEQYFRHRPDITLMDLRMPELDGIEAISAIRKEDPGARIICLTSYDGDEDIYRALHAGAKGYLLKEAGAQLIWTCIRAVHSGESWIQPSVAAKLAARVSRPDLTRRELEVLELVVKGKSNKEIGSLLSITEGTVKVHLNHIFAKLGVSGRTEVATAALNRGIVHSPPK